MTDPLEQFRWLDADENECPLGGIFSVSFFQGLGPDEVLRRFGAVPAEGQLMGFGQFFDLAEKFLSGGAGGGSVGVLDTGRWSVAVELWGWEATLPDVLEGLSLDCEVVAIMRHDYAEHSFEYAVDGSITTGFDPHVPGDRHGSDPDGLNSLIRRIGLDPDYEEMCADDPVAMSFALAAEITGMAFTPSALEQPLLVGGPLVAIAGGELPR